MHVAKLTPPPPSVSRQLAYQEKSPLIGPLGDPEGWHTLEPIAVRGASFGKTADIIYTVRNVRLRLVFVAHSG